MNERRCGVKQVTKQQYVTIKGTKEGLVLRLDDKCSYSDLLTELRKKVAEDGLEGLSEVQIHTGNRYCNEEELKEFDPLTYKDKFYTRPILMLHGDSDTSVPIDIQRYFYKEVVSLYEDNPEKIKLEESKKMNHHISIRMVESTVMWLDKYL